MTAGELCAVQLTLGLSDEALAAELALTPELVSAWRAATIAIPNRYGRMLRWRTTIAERQAAAEASGLPVCAWVQA